ncbi:MULTISPECIES: phosphopantetheine-binding protein [Roseivirga]|uniref:Carrier domain-containing protein n=1 Tax=Roseivirga spongicola TaxID=333140 RepID=A0A150X439_9BACT|nr:MULTISPECIES: phosphopantetheine-binding protein [Roseivirga]KYG73467.1 hypothetical protein AWW68_12295 [Roseivirga spongicola]MBO6659729.1 hypothetical protein [Roseivirga sp.]MBO6760092.1 hypothetical protein [Roseivirga sp.]MBO6907534.1 hypothetical protein [Roseivirga sp.]WPZ09908.1 phosphopantetheine-binding protein [Roseivirga spongicola]|tara:strand:- start:239 stop:487 length:249 start_codon:yes stop_codon:yes gene_type:complete
MEIKKRLKDYLVQNVLDQNEAGQLSDTTTLISSGIVDSITTLQLVEFIETEFNIEFDAHEVDRDNLDTLILIENFVERKRQG